MKTVPWRRSQLASPHPATDQLEPRGWASPVSGSRHSPELSVNMIRCLIF